MALQTLADVRTRYQDTYRADIIDETRKDPLLDIMPFDDNISFTGSSLFYTYSRLKNSAGAGFRKLGEEYQKTSAGTENVTAQLRPIGNAGEIERQIIKGFLSRGRTTAATELMFQLYELHKSTKKAFSDAFINGDAGTPEAPTGEFDGINKTVTGTQMDFSFLDPVDIRATTGGSNDDLFLSQLDEAIGDMDGTPSVILYNRKVQPVLNRIYRNSGLLTTHKNAMGVTLTAYGDTILLPVGEKPGSNNPIIPIVGGVTSLYAVRLGLDGVHAITSNPDIIDIFLPNLDHQVDVNQKFGTEMMTAVAVKNRRALAKVGNIQVDALPVGP